MENYIFALKYCTIFGFLNFHVSHLNHEKFKLCLQNTLNMSKTTRVYYGALQFSSRVRHYSFTTFLKYNNFCEHHFVIVLYALSFFLSFIAKGLATCRLGGVISAQKVLF